MRRSAGMLMLCITGGFVCASGAGAQVGNPAVFDAHAHLVEFTGGGNWIESQRAAARSNVFE